MEKDETMREKLGAQNYILGKMEAAAAEEGEGKLSGEGRREGNSVYPRRWGLVVV